MTSAAGIYHLHLDLHARGLYDGFQSVIDIGALDSIPSSTDVEKLIRIYGFDGVDPDTLTLEDLYKSFGLSRHAVLGGTAPENAFGHDLNEPLHDDSLTNTFDVVTDHGISENVFAADTVYETMHRLCRPGGLIVICNTFWRGTGFNSPIPEIFEDAAAINGYDILFSAFEINGQFVSIGSRVNEVIPNTTPLGFCYVLRKNGDQAFLPPYQHQLMRQAHGIVSFEESYLEDGSLGRRYVPHDVEQTRDEISTGQAIGILLGKLRTRLGLR